MLELKIVDFIYFHFFFLFLFLFIFLFLNLELEISIILYMTVTNCYTSVTQSHVIQKTIESFRTMILGYMLTNIIYIFFRVG